MEEGIADRVKGHSHASPPLCRHVYHDQIYMHIPDFSVPGFVKKAHETQVNPSCPCRPILPNGNYTSVGVSVLSISLNCTHKKAQTFVSAIDHLVFIQNLTHFFNFGGKAQSDWTFEFLIQGEWWNDKNRVETRSHVCQWMLPG